jgi:starch-binding outer membrane protein, SusD/RagB family
MKKIIIYLSLFALVITSCSKVLETTPRNEVDLGTATTNLEALQGVLVAVYNQLQGSGYYGRDFIVIPELLADNAEITAQNSNRFVQQANNTPRSHQGIFAGAYTGIFRCNFVLKFADKATTDATIQNQLKGESYFLRSLLYFDLVRTYARNPRFLVNNFDLGVPIILDPVTDLTQVTYPNRAKVSEVYAQIVSDLNSAISLLPAGGNRYKANKAAAQGLLSRVYLYMGNWVEAENKATDCINSNFATFADSANYYGKWGNGSPEQLFGISYEASESLVFDAIQSIYYFHPTFQGYGDITARAELLNDFYPGDYRRSKLIKQTTKGTQTVYYTLKWPGAKGAFGLDDIMIIRITEVYLNRAEARAMQTGKEALALQDLNKVHVRAGLAPLGPLTGQALIDAIQRERRLELAFEGHRLYDLLRWGRDVVKGGATTSLAWDDYRLIAPIPQGEIDVNPNLKPQNPGY